MLIRLSQWSARCLVALVLALACATPSLAQDDEEANKPFREPGVSYRKVSSVKPYIDWAFAALLIAAAGVIAFKNPHRGHLD